jgi:signal transduction histidine kinase
MELSWTREALRPSFGDVRDSVDRAVQAIRAHPEFHEVRISVSCKRKCVGWFDPKKVERVLYNLLRNACEVVPKEAGTVEVELLDSPGSVEIRVSDNGPGIPGPVRQRLFEPFVSFGKENGSGMGLAVAQKIVQHHGGEISVERTSEAGTVFKLTMPLTLEPKEVPSSTGQSILASQAGGVRPTPID